MPFALLPQLQQSFTQLHSRAEAFSLRYVGERSQAFSVRKNVAEAPSFGSDAGAMLTV